MKKVWFGAIEKKLPLAEASSLIGFAKILKYYQIYFLSNLFYVFSSRHLHDHLSRFFVFLLIWVRAVGCLKFFLALFPAQIRHWLSVFHYVASKNFQSLKSVTILKNSYIFRNIWNWPHKVILIISEALFLHLLRHKQQAVPSTALPCTWWDGRSLGPVNWGMNGESSGPKHLNDRPS